MQAPRNHVARAWWKLRFQLSLCDSYVGGAEKLAAAGQIVRLVLANPENKEAAAPEAGASQAAGAAHPSSCDGEIELPHSRVGDQVGER